MKNISTGAHNSAAMAATSSMQYAMADVDGRRRRRFFQPMTFYTFLNDYSMSGDLVEVIEALEELLPDTATND